MKRRNFIRNSALGTAALSTIGAGSVLAANNSKKRVLRIAHITDMHLFPGEAPQKGIGKLLEELHGLEDKPDFVINTGDNIMDALKREKTEVAAQWDVWQKTFKDELQYELFNCIGNHDVWGWGLKDKQPKDDPLFGKAWAKQMLGLEKSTFYSVVRNGWKIIFLDSPFYDENDHAYTARIDDEQFAWLQKTLAETSEHTPVMLASHIPILAPSVFFDGDNEKSGNWRIPGSWMHIDVRRIKDLLRKHSNVKLAISGHVHLADEVRYLDVDYVCNGAACGGWWEGPYQEFHPSYALIDLYEDGSFTNELHTYQWK
jgi:3',5'-cyclic AMP phosphodiesterase CpdA